jgi:hypothetical protein
MGFVVIFNWIFNSTGGSVLILMLTHAMNNTMSGSFVGPLFLGVDSVRQAWFSAALWCVLAIMVIVVARPEHLSRRHRQQDALVESGPQMTGPPSAATVLECGRVTFSDPKAQ